MTAPHLHQTLDRSNSDVVLIVDDVPDNLAVLHDALDESGYTVLVATSGERGAGARRTGAARHRAARRHDAGHGRLRGRRRLKAAPQTAHIPIIFMTGLTETEHLVAALEAGGVDYVTKPIRPKEVLARMNVHMQGARQARQTRNALDAFGYASIAVRAATAACCGRRRWRASCCWPTTAAAARWRPSPSWPGCAATCAKPSSRSSRRA
jgi:DNA-binding response OmpR family regulator